MKKLCIVVPYRDRADHLSQFVPRIKKTMDDQGILFELLVVEQENGKPFNRGKLLNVGFHWMETEGKREIDYYCFHDVDMLPTESDYSYCENPTHLAARAEQFGWKLPYNDYFGGVTIFDKGSFLKINGYANEYWGWGAEDDDVFKRCRKAGVKMSRKNCSYISLLHDHNVDRNEYGRNLSLLDKWEENAKYDGLNTLRYVVKEKIEIDGYKKITVEL